jgi:hypothetical protein
MAALKAKFLDGASRRAANDPMKDMSVEAGGSLENGQTVDAIKVRSGTTISGLQLYYIWIV